MRETLILASASPRRRELLHQLGLEFEVRISTAEEATSDHPSDPASYAQRLALIKAEDVATTVTRGVVIGADTVVVLNNEIINKPESTEGAMAMLSRLQGRSHQVITGVALLDVEDGHIRHRDVRHEITEVRMRPVACHEIEAYVATGEPMDKAGAYGIQGRAAAFVEGITGDYSNVVGLPLCLLWKMLNANPAS